MATFDFRVLGPLEVWRDGELVAIPGPKQRALLGLLLLRANEPVPQAELIDRLWGGEAPPTARASLQNQVHALRRRLGPESLERQAGGYVLNVERGELDLERFESLVAEARQAEPKERARKLRDALSLWRGPPLVEFPSEPFAQSEIVRLEEERLAALEDRIDAELELELHVELVPELESLVGLYPLRERLWGQLMISLYRSGRQADALATYSRAHAAFADGLGVEPGVALRELQRAVLLQDRDLEPGHELGWTLERAATFLPWGPRERAESLLEYAHALTRAGELRKAVSTYEAAMRAAKRAGDHSVEHRARLTLLHRGVWSEGASPLAFLGEVERAGREFEVRGDLPGLLLALRFKWFNVWTALGQADESARLALRSAELAALLGDRTSEGDSLAHRVLFLAVGSTPVADALAESEALRTRYDWNDSSTSPEVSVRFWCGLGLLHGQLGDLEVATRYCERAVGHARSTGALFLYGDALVWRAAVEYVNGDVDAAATSLRSAYTAIETETDHAFGLMTAAGLACVLALRGEHDEASGLADRARAGSTDDFMTQVLWRRALALVTAQTGHVAEAVRLSDEARARLTASDWLLLRGMVLEEAAVVRGLAGDAVGEIEALEEALVVYENKGNVVGAARVEEAIRGRVG